MLCSTIQKSQCYAVIVDGTHNISRCEQESDCIRFVDDILESLETFLGFYAVSEATGSNLAKCVKDVFLRCNLPLEKLRGQSYDGASNMSEAYNGCRHHCQRTITSHLCPLRSTVRESYRNCCVCSVDNGS